MKLFMFYIGIALFAVLLIGNFNGIAKAIPDNRPTETLPSKEVTKEREVIRETVYNSTVNNSTVNTTINTYVNQYECREHDLRVEVYGDEVLITNR